LLEVADNGTGEVQVNPVFSLIVIVQLILVARVLTKISGKRSRSRGEKREFGFLRFERGRGERILSD
jgi:hypothetical protein